jgi:GT2 family glycosyltransferase
LTDDGCTDGTASAVLSAFPEQQIIIIKGNGQLFWAGGMRSAWHESLKNDHDGYLLINDDTVFNLNAFTELINTDIFSLKTYRKRGVYVGTTVDFENSQIVTYGGSIVIDYWRLLTRTVIPNSINPQECDFGNANIMFVPHEVVLQIGIFSSIYLHSGADYDFTYKAKKNNIPVLITPNFCGFCNNDHPVDIQAFSKMTIIQRFKFTFLPTGFGANDYLKLNYIYFAYRLPFCISKVWIRILFPKLYMYFFRA